jgi:hypothetical protein
MALLYTLALPGEKKKPRGSSGIRMKMKLSPYLPG